MNDRVSKRSGISRGDEDAGLPVSHQLTGPPTEAAMTGRDAHRLERDHASLPIEGITTTAARSVALDGRHIPKADQSAMRELQRERSQRRLERSRGPDLELERGGLSFRISEGSKEHDMALDRDQPADAEEPRYPVGVRLQLAVGIDAVVDDLEAVAVEPSHVLEVECRPRGWRCARARARERDPRHRNTAFRGTR